jgi:hypothetical protein
MHEEEQMAKQVSQLQRQAIMQKLEEKAQLANEKH